MLRSARTLHAEAAWEALEADEAAARDGLPNRACPSDHLPVGACFLVTPTLTLALTLTLTLTLIRTRARARARTRTRTRSLTRTLTR